MALIIVAGSLWYSNTIVDKISQEERKKVTLWAQAIQRKADLVNYTQELFEKIGTEERKKVELWSEASKLLASSDFTGDYTFVLKVVSDNTSVPVILTDEDGTIISHRNLDQFKSKNEEWLKKQIQVMAKIHNPIEITYYRSKKNYLYYQDSKLFSELKDVMNDLIKSFISEIVINNASLPVVYINYSTQEIIAYGNIKQEILDDNKKLQALINEMKTENPPIEITLNNEELSYIYYSSSDLLRTIKYYPLVQLMVVSLFIFLSYWLFSTYRKAEQNQVWAGMAKETAHQLGTPISSLMAWVEYLKLKNVDDEITNEINKDIHRLEVVADRFSKIGSSPELSESDIVSTLENIVDYIKKRSSSSISFQLHLPEQPISVKFNKILLEWVLENILKNAIDSMPGTGSIDIFTEETPQHFMIDIKDSGKGIAPNSLQSIFEPGFTTKKRGWGLGLSLAKRIIEEYHFGKIFVKESEVGKGTTFRIILNK